jgi:hypothetical protein
MISVAKSSLTIAQLFRTSRDTIDACVVVGAALFWDTETYTELCKAATRGVSVRLLFPAPDSPWLDEYARKADTDDAVGFRRDLVRAGQRASRLVSGAAVRWYDAPGPCWFTIVDGKVAYRKSLDASRSETLVEEQRCLEVEHLHLVFDQLWELSLQ